METLVLQVVPLTSEAFAPFGQVIGTDDLHVAAYDEEALHLDILSKRWESIRITSFNRHFKATQAQVALAGRPTVIVVGPGDVDLRSRKDLERFRAFVCDGTTGFNLALRTWHSGAHPLMQDVDLLNLQGLHPAVDIEIVDIVERLDTEVTLQL